MAEAKATISKRRVKKSWREKLANARDLPRVERIAGRMSTRWGKGTVVIPAPRQVDAMMRRVPRGRLITINEIRSRLAKKHGATIGCPITTGIFAWIAAHAAEEDRLDGATAITPYWRTLKSGGELNARYPGGIAHLRQQLEAEGHGIIQRGKRWFVEGYEKVLVGRRKENRNL